MANRLQGITFPGIEGEYKIGEIKCFGSLRDVGITGFPTTMAEVAEKMPPNSMIIMGTGSLNSGGSEEIEDWGKSVNGTAYINKGANATRVTMMILYGSSNSSGCNIHIGNWSQNAEAGKKVQWDNPLLLSGGTMTGNLNMGGNKLTGLPEPVSNTDAATMSYVDSKAIATGVAYEGFKYQYVDGNTTDTVQDGTLAHPFKTMDQFFDACNKSGKLEFRCMIQSAGTYKISKTQFAGGSFHIRAQQTISRDDVKLVFANDNWEAGIVSCYGTHYNFRNVTLVNKSDNSDTSGFSFETCVVGLDGCRVIGKQIRFTQCYLSISAFAKDDGTKTQTSLTNLICSGCNGHIDDLVIANDSTVNTNKLRPITIGAGSNILFNGTLTVPAPPTSGTSMLMSIAGSQIYFCSNGNTEPRITRSSTSAKYSRGIHSKVSTIFMPEPYASDLGRVAVTATYEEFGLPSQWITA